MLKEKSCKIVSVLSDDDNITVVSHSNFEDEKHALAAQDIAPQPTGTRSGKSYLRQYKKTTDETQQPTTSEKVLFQLQLLQQERKSKKKSDFTDY